MICWENFRIRMGSLRLQLFLSTKLRKIRQNQKTVIFIGKISLGISRKISASTIKEFLEYKPLFEAKDEIQMHKIMPMFKKELGARLEAMVVPRHKASLKGNVSMLLKKAVKHSHIDSTVKVGAGYLTALGQDVVDGKFYDRILRQHIVFKHPQNFDSFFSKEKEPLVYKEYSSSEINILYKYNSDLRPSIRNFTIDTVHETLFDFLPP